MLNQIPTFLLLLPIASLFGAVGPEIREEVFRAETAVVVRSEPNIYSSKIRVLKKGTYIDGTLNGDVETIQGKSGQWLAIPGEFLDRHIFTGFMSRQTGKVRKQLLKDCEVIKHRLACTGYEAGIAKDVMVYLEASGCAGTHFHRHPLKVDDSGESTLAREIRKIPKGMILQVFTKIENSEVVQVFFYESSPDCS